MSKRAATLAEAIDKAPGRNGTPTPKERLWAAHYVTDPARNATQAARDAGYAHPRVMGQRVSQRPRVKAVVRHLEAEARKRLKIKEAKATTVEVLPPGTPAPNAKTLAVGCSVVAIEATEEAAVVSRAEALAVAANIIRSHETRKVSDLFLPAGGSKKGGNLVMDSAKVAELPLTMVKGLKHDAAGDLELKLADPLAAARLVLDDHRRAAEGDSAVDIASALLEVLRGAIGGRAQGSLPE